MGKIKIIPLYSKIAKLNFNFNFSFSFELSLALLSNRAVFFFLPSCEPWQGQQDFLCNFVEVLSLRQQKILKYFVGFPVRAFIFCEQSSQVHGEKDGLLSNFPTTHQSTQPCKLCSKISAQVPAAGITRIYSNIQIIATEYYIFEYEYSIFLFRIYSIFVFGQVAKNEYIRYSYSVRLGGTYRVSHKKVYLLKTSISQAPYIAQKKFGTRNESIYILFQKQKLKFF